MKSSWLVIAFAGGVAVGVVVTQVSTHTPATAATTVEAPVAGSAPSAVAPELNRAKDAQPAHPLEATTGSTGQPSAPQASLAAAPMDQRGAAVDDMPVQPIDVGLAFKDEIARSSVPGFENQLGEAHRALERETRNDGWAYTMEAEIQNTMINEVSAGAFRMEHVECRATMCEARVSGSADQAEAIKHWREGLGAQPLGQHLVPNYSSSIGNEERFDALIIFRRPPPMPPRPR